LGDRIEFTIKGTGPLMVTARAGAIAVASALCQLDLAFLRPQLGIAKSLHDVLALDIREVRQHLLDTPPGTDLTDEHADSHPRATDERLVAN
jgi:hypothetical protein